MEFELANLPGFRNARSTYLAVAEIGELGSWITFGLRIRSPSVTQRTPASGVSRAVWLGCLVHDGLGFGSWSNHVHKREC